MQKKYRLLAATGTHPGQLREINQDHVLAFIRPEELGEALGLFIVADGMGGHQAGEIASQLAVEAVRQTLSWMLDQDDSESTAPLRSPNKSDKEAEAERLQRRLGVAIEQANKVIYDYARSNPIEAGNLGCTATCAMIYGRSAVIANVGDSRTYRLNGGELIQITNDHSYVWQLVTEGQLGSDEIYDHPQRNVITRALGNQPEVAVDLWTCTLEVGDRLLLCSDGMWEMIRNPSEIADMLRCQTLETAVSRLIDAANKYGGSDNIGVVVAELRAHDDEGQVSDGSD